VQRKRVCSVRQYATEDGQQAMGGRPWAAGSSASPASLTEPGAEQNVVEDAAGFEAALVLDMPAAGL